ncbi:MAG: hypothetical protein IT385_02860 [Deltaproteobacteria bacterium]|nr:hypothetical protein [Deltaproteobacteria bacterium]
MWSSLVAVALLAASPDPTVAPAPAAPPPAPAPAPPTRVNAPAATRLPDGTFEGAMVGATEGMTLHLTVVAGLVTRFEVRRPDEAPLALKPSGSPGDVGLRFSGRADGGFVSVSGGFTDSERAGGRFEGTLGKRRVQGTWRLERR